MSEPDDAPENPPTPDHEGDGVFVIGDNESHDGNDDNGDDNGDDDEQDGLMADGSSSAMVEGGKYPNGAGGGKTKIRTNRADATSFSSWMASIRWHFCDALSSSSSSSSLSSSLSSHDRHRRGLRMILALLFLTATGLVVAGIVLGWQEHRYKQSEWAFVDTPPWGTTRLLSGQFGSVYGIPLREGPSTRRATTTPEGDSAPQGQSPYRYELRLGRLRARADAETAILSLYRGDPGWIRPHFCHDVDAMATEYDTPCIRSETIMILGRERNDHDDHASDGHDHDHDHANDGTYVLALMLAMPDGGGGGAPGAGAGGHTTAALDILNEPGDVFLTSETGGTVAMYTGHSDDPYALLQEGAALGALLASSSRDNNNSRTTTDHPDNFCRLAPPSFHDAHPTFTHIPSLPSGRDAGAGGEDGAAAGGRGGAAGGQHHGRGRGRRHRPPHASKTTTPPPPPCQDDPKFRMDRRFDCQGVALNTDEDALAGLCTDPDFGRSCCATCDSVRHVAPNDLPQCRDDPHVKFDVNKTCSDLWIHEDDGDEGPSAAAAHHMVLLCTHLSDVSNYCCASCRQAALQDKTADGDDEGQQPQDEQEEASSSSSYSSPSPFCEDADDENYRVAGQYSCGDLMEISTIDELLSFCTNPEFAYRCCFTCRNVEDELRSSSPAAAPTPSPSSIGDDEGEGDGKNNKNGTDETCQDDDDYSLGGMACKEIKSGGGIELLCRHKVDFPIKCCNTCFADGGGGGISSSSSAPCQGDDPSFLLAREFTCEDIGNFAEEAEVYSLCVASGEFRSRCCAICEAMERAVVEPPSGAACHDDESFVFLGGKTCRELWLSGEMDRLCHRVSDVADHCCQACRTAPPTVTGQCDEGEAPFRISAHFAAYLGWSTWDAYHLHLGGDKIVNGVRAMHEDFVPVGWLIIDDGWQMTTTDLEGEPVDVDERFRQRLVGYGADGYHFPHIIETIELLKSDEGLDLTNVFAFHTLAGYWNGILGGALVGPNATVYRAQIPKGLVRNDPTLLQDAAVEPGIAVMQRAQKFYRRYYEALVVLGFDGVKVDGQGMIGLLRPNTNTTAFRHALSRTLQDAIAAALSVFVEENELKVPIIHSMSHAPELLYRLPSSFSREATPGHHLRPFLRAAENFDPNHTARGQAEHVRSLVYNSLLLQHLATPDWDMFQTIMEENDDDDDRASSRSVAKLHAVARAVSGGPIYISDVPGKSNSTLIAALVCLDGTVLACANTATPIRSSLLRDPIMTMGGGGRSGGGGDDDRPLVVWNTNAKHLSGVLAILQLNAFVAGSSSSSSTTTTRRTITLSPSDIEPYRGPAYSSSNVSFLVYDNEEKTAREVWTNTERISLTPPSDVLEFWSKVLTVVPVTTVQLNNRYRMAPIGFVGKFNSAGAVLDVVARHERLHLQMRGCGNALILIRPHGDDGRGGGGHGRSRGGGGSMTVVPTHVHVTLDASSSSSSSSESSEPLKLPSKIQNPPVITTGLSDEWLEVTFELPCVKKSEKAERWARIEWK